MEPAHSSPYGLLNLWSQGDLAIKAVALILLLMSVVSWWLIVTRAWRLIRLRRAARAAAAFWHARSFDEGLQALRAPGTPAPGLNPFHGLVLEGRAAAVHHEASREELHGQLSLAEWVGDALRAAIDDSADRLRSGLSVLASVASTAPFVGLFGTVWGIMNAFIGISEAHTTNLAVVAPGIAEALLATAMGLIAAIPAVIIYNVLVRGITAYRALLGDASAQVLLVLSRQSSLAAAHGRTPVARAAE